MDNGSLLAGKENCVLICKYERCGRKFESQDRLKDHIIRMHEKGGNLLEIKSNEGVKFPMIQGNDVVGQAKNLKMKGDVINDQLHRTIREAQIITNYQKEGLMNNSGGFGRLKKPSFTSPIVNDTSRPSSGSSSAMNTTSSSASQGEFSIRQSSLKKIVSNELEASKSLKKLSVKDAGKNQFDVLKSDCLEKSSIKGGFIQQGNKTQTIQRVKTKEEILFGRNKQFAEKKGVLAKCNEKGSINRREMKINDGSEDEDDLKKVDNILNMNFSDEEEEKEDDHLRNEINMPKEEYQKCENETKNFLSKQFILDSTGCESLDEVEQLIFRKKGLVCFSENEGVVDWSELKNLRYLSVSHNPYLSDISALRSFPNRSLLVISMEYNQIKDISDFFRHIQLQELHLNGNIIETIQGVEVLSQLRILSLMKNAIRGFETTITTISMLDNLKELELENNPMSSRFNYKYDVLWRLKLSKLDGEEVTPADIEFSKAFQSERHSFNRDNSQANISLPIRPKTAKQLKNQASSQNLQNSYQQRFKQKIGELVQQSKEVLNCIPEDRQAELETEIELARMQEKLIEEELLLLQLEVRDHQEKKDKLIIQNEEFASTISEYQQLQSLQTGLLKKINSYIDQMKTNTSESAPFIKAVFKLNFKFEELQQEHTQLSNESKVLQSTSQSFFSQNKNENNSENKSIIKDVLNSQKELLSQSHAKFNKYNQKQNQQLVYDDAEDVFSQEEDENVDKEFQQKQIVDIESQSKDILSNKENKQLNSQTYQKVGVANQCDDDNEGEQEDDKDSEDDINQGVLDLDIGFDSDDLDEETKEIKQILQNNSQALKQVKNTLHKL